MQTATTMKRFVFNHTGATAVALSILIGGAIGITALTINSDVPASTTIESVRTMPRAFVSDGQGEGLIDPGNTRVAAKAPLKAFVWDEQGEGLIDGSNTRMVATAPVDAFVWDGQVTGLIDGADRAPVKAYLGLGQGEGLVDPANRTINQNLPKTYSSPED